MHSVRLEPTKLMLIGTRTTYQATGDAVSRVYGTVWFAWSPLSLRCYRYLIIAGSSVICYCKLSIRWSDIDFFLEKLN